MSNNGMQLAIEIVVNGLKQASESMETFGKKLGSIGGEFKAGLREGMDAAIKELDRPQKELEELAKNAREVLKVRSHADVVSIRARP